MRNIIQNVSEKESLRKEHQLSEDELMEKVSLRIINVYPMHANFNEKFGIMLIVMKLQILNITTSLLIQGKRWNSIWFPRAR